MSEKLSSWFPRIEKSQFADYSVKYKDFMKMKRKDGILQIQFHTNGGPLQFSWLIHSAWSQAWIDIGRDPENQVLIITGTGDRWLEANPNVWKTLFRDWTEDDKLKMYHESFRLLENLIFGLDIPTIGAVNGPGTHCEIATLCDLTLCTEDSDFFDPHFLGGTPPGDGMFLTLQQLIGPKRAAYFAYTGKPIDGKTALELGIVNEVLSREKLQERALELARMMMERPRSTRNLTHAIANRTWKQTLVNDQGFHLAHQMYAMANSETNVVNRLLQNKARFMNSDK
jgi:enoyl-CoA hydratase/carnithine racemase